MPQGQPQGGSWEAPGRPAAALVFGLVRSKRSLIAGCGGQGCVPGQGGGRLLWGDRGCPRDGQVVLVPESQPREGTELAHSWAAAPCGFPLSHGCNLPYSSLGRSLQRDYNEGPSCNEFDCCFSTINSFNFFHFKVP